MNTLDLIVNVIAIAAALIYIYFGIGLSRGDIDGKAKEI